MSKVISTIQWNIGGGKIRRKENDPMNPLSYCHDNLNVVIEILKKYNPDIITLQECHNDKKQSQAKIIADSLNYKYYINDIYAKSHLEEGKYLSQCIISRYPIIRHSFKFFINPKFKTIGPSGEKWISHNKGVTSGSVLFDGNIVNIKTCHLVPFRRFNVDPLSDELIFLRKDITNKLKSSSTLFLLQGDLNFNNYSAKPLLPDLFNGDVKEVLLGSPTTPKNRKYDHILFSSFKHNKSEIISDLLTDHFPIYSQFNL